MGQVTLAVAIAVSLLWLVYRRRKARDLHLALEQLVAETALTLAEGGQARLEQSILEALARLTALTRSKLVSIQTVESRGVIEARRAFLYPPDPEFADPKRLASCFPFLYSVVLSGHDVRMPAYRFLHPDAKVDLASLRRKGIFSGFALQVKVRGQLRGAISIGLGAARAWKHEWVEPVRRLGQVILTAYFDYRCAPAERGSARANDELPSSVESFVAILDRDARVTSTNRHMEIAGVTAGADYPPSDVLDAVHHASLKEAMQSVMKGEVPYAGLLVRLPEDQWHMVQIEPLSHRDGGVIVIHTDVTQRRQSEAAGRRALGELEHWNRISSIAELAMSLAHEISQPLSAITANVSAANRLAAGPNPDMETIRAILADAAADGKRAGDVIRNLRLLLSRNSPPAARRVDLNQLASQTLRLVAHEAAQRQVRLQADMLETALEVSVNPVQLQQVMLNLLTNAIDAATFRPADDREVKLRTRADGSDALIEVEDTGAGIPAAHLEKIFEPFYTTKSMGLGVGLSISRAIVSRAGGRIWAERAANGRTRFSVRIPGLTG